jgi:hypothetical protein
LETIPLAIYGDVLKVCNISDEVHIEIPEGIREIAEGAFRGTSYIIETIKLPSTLKVIGKKGLPNSLKEITIPEGVEAIPESLFYNMKSLKSVELPDTVTAIDVGAFGDCVSLEHIDFPSNLTHIYDEAFYHSGLTGDIVFPPSLKYIGCCAFEEVGGLEGVSFYFEGIPKTIEEDSFYGDGIFAIYFRCSEDEAPEGAPWGAENAEIIYDWEE